MIIMVCFCGPVLQFAEPLLAGITSYLLIQYAFKTHKVPAPFNFSVSFAGFLL